MIKSIIATTMEIDDPKIAVEEILSGLEIEKNLKKNSIGIVSCFSEFSETGVLKAICDALPFECIGTTTCISAAGNEIDNLLFSLLVLTSDEIEFKTEIIPIVDDFEKNIETTMAEFRKNTKEKPALFLGYFPLLHHIGCDMILTALDKATDGIPVFGTVAVDHKNDYSTAQTIYNGVAYRDRLVLGAIIGEVDMIFEIASINEDNIRKQKAIITESNGNILIGVNGKSAISYLEEIGLTKAEIATGLGVIPLIVDHKDGTKPVARAVFAATPDGHVVCGGAMPVGATLALGRVDVNDVLSTTETTMKHLMKKDSIILSYSCVARYLVLGADVSAEGEKIQDIAGNEISFIYTCCGGEICPLLDANGNWKNYFHNYTNAFCRLG